LGSGVETALTPDERIALIGNEWALMQIGKHHIGDYLALGAQLKDTPGAELLGNFAEHLAGVYAHSLTDADRPEFQGWVRTQFSPALQELGYDGRPSDTPEQKQKRAILFEILGNLGDDPQVIQQARTMVQEYMKDPASIDGTLAGAVVSVAARHGDAELYQQYKAAMQRAKSPQEMYRFFYTLAEFPQPELTKETLDSLLTPAVRGQDLFVLIDLLQMPSSQDQTWDFMRSHFDQLLAKTGGGLGGLGIFMYGAQVFCSTEKADEVQQFFQQHPFPGTERNQRQAIGRIKSCAELVQQQRPNLAAWLKQQGSATNASSGGGDASSGTSAR